MVVLNAYETQHDLVILDPSEYEGLRALCGAHSDMELGPSELFQFLSSASPLFLATKLIRQNDSETSSRTTCFFPPYDFA
jgi:hypothetical protein